MKQCWQRFRELDSPVQYSVGYLVVWVIMLLELRTTQFLPDWFHFAFCLFSIGLIGYWYKRVTHSLSLIHI